MSTVEKLLLLALLVVPFFVVMVVWPAFLNAAIGPAPTPVAAVATTPSPTSSISVLGAQATRTLATASPVRTPTPAATAGTPARTTSPSPVATRTAVPSPTAAATRTAVPSPTTATAPTHTLVTATATTSGPVAAVGQFYQDISGHQFAAAAQLWSPRMQAAYPPDANINQRFASTTAIDMNSTRLVSEDDAAGTATVAVDLTEHAPSATRHYTGTFGVVRQGGQWLLDQPNLQLVP